MSTIPDRIKESVQRYVEHGIEPGGFMSAVITNNLAEAVHRADPENYANIRAIVEYVRENIPSHKRGSKEAFNSWIDPRARVE